MLTAPHRPSGFPRLLLVLSAASLFLSLTAYGQTTDVDEGRGPVPGQVAQCSFEVVFKHDNFLPKISQIGSSF